MANPNLLDPGERLRIIQSIKGDENKRRKAESLRRFEVYKERQANYIEQKLRTEFSEKTVREMRKITSINLAKRMIDEVASLYTNGVDREFSNTTEIETENIEMLYDEGKVDSKMAYANKLFKLNDQVILQVIPWDKKITVRPLLPHWVDVVPDEMNPEKAFCYIISVFDKFEFLAAATNVNVSNPSRTGLSGSNGSDGYNQEIADQEDYKASLERYEVWSNELNFFMDGRGNIVSDAKAIDNQIGELPFVDVAVQKDYEFWVRNGNGFVDFAIDFGSQLSDISNIIKLQGYAQCVMTASKQPQNMMIGPNHVLWLEQDQNAAKDPKFEFVSASPDLKSSLDFLEMTIRLFLASKGIDAKAISGQLQGQTFSSGLERLLAMISKFEVSKQDMELFRHAEDRVFDLMVKWNNLVQGTDLVDKDLQLGAINDKVEMTIQYKEPQDVQTKSDLEDSVIKRLDNGLLTKKDAIIEIYGVDDTRADEMVAEIQAEKLVAVPSAFIVNEDQGIGQNQTVDNGSAPNPPPANNLNPVQ